LLTLFLFRGTIFCDVIASLKPVKKSGRLKSDLKPTVVYSDLSMTMNIFHQDAQSKPAIYCRKDKPMGVAFALNSKPISLILLTALLLLCTSCISLPEDAREVFDPVDSTSNNNYKKGSE